MRASQKTASDLTVGKVTTLVVGAVVVVFLLQVSYALWVFQAFPNQMDTRGQFGDLFGAVNAFFTGLAFAGVVFTIFLQRRELSFQREELEATTALSVIASLVDTYTSQIATMEQGNFRGELWAANTEIKEKVKGWDKEEVARPPGNQQAMRKNIENSVADYMGQHADSPVSKWLGKRQNRDAFIAWVYARRRHNHFRAILDEEFEKVWRQR